MYDSVPQSKFCRPGPRQELRVVIVDQRKALSIVMQLGGSVHTHQTTLACTRGFSRSLGTLEPKVASGIHASRTLSSRDGSHCSSQVRTWPVMNRNIICPFLQLPPSLLYKVPYISSDVTGTLFTRRFQLLQPRHSTLPLLLL